MKKTSGPGHWQALYIYSSQAYDHVENMKGERRRRRIKGHRVKAKHRAHGGSEDVDSHSIGLARPRGR